jgi:predicted CopG family antitoxin
MQEEKETTQKIVRISDYTYNRLSSLGTVKDSFNDVIERLINCYELHNSGLHSISLQLLNEDVDFPNKPEDKKITLQLFKKILSLGENVSYTLRYDRSITPLIEARKNNIIFFKDNYPFCLVKTTSGGTEFYFPSNEKNSGIPGWKFSKNLSAGVDFVFPYIQRVYEDWKPGNL